MQILIKKKLNKFLSAAIVLFFIIGLLPQTALAAGSTYAFDLAGGSITITSNTVTQSGTDTAFSFGDELVITQSGAGSTANTITVNGGAEAINITLSGVNIDTSSCAFEMKGSSNVNLTLAEGTINTLISGGIYAGLQAMGNTTIIISGSGSLDVTGGTTDATFYGRTNAAGIGGSAGESEVGDGDGGDGADGGNITISGGDITVTGNIGGGDGGSR